MTDATSPGPNQPTEEERKQARGRLIDHFKRVHSLIVGLAITEAVRRQFMSTLPFPNPSLLMFFTFFITVVPIFHGGDRSLDVKYLGRSQVGLRKRVSYLWDVYMLLITAMLFVSVAEAIPNKDGFLTHDAAVFYLMFTVTLVVDIVILLIDRCKSEPATRARLAPYAIWIGANTVLA